MSLISGIPNWFIYVIIGLTSIIGLTIILERGWVLLKKTTSLNYDEQSQLLSYIADRKFEDALSFCRLQSHPGYKIALRLIQVREQKSDFDRFIEEEQMKQLVSLEKYLPTLGSISTVAPLLGLLGTVTGMIKSFHAFQQSASRSAQLMGGIDEALITTALGLMVAIPSLIMYNYYVRKVVVLSDEAMILGKAVRA